MLTAMLMLGLVVVADMRVTQKARPNFSGTWLLVAPADVAVQPPGQEETITQTDATITFGHHSEGGGHQLTCGLDGRWRGAPLRAPESRVGARGRIPGSFWWNVHTRAAM